jgi:4'-phosphopantetheinyl transferase EntD
MSPLENQQVPGPSAVRLSEALGALFPSGVAAAELTDDWFSPCSSEEVESEALEQARLLLTDPEWQSIAHCRVARIRDYTAGRLCAHRALAAMGVAHFSVLSAPDRRALWPAGLSGSITHTSGYAAAAVGLQSEVGSLGLDTERIEDVDEKLWPDVCTAAELRQLNDWPRAARAQAAALCFVAKEAFYKAQFALCAEPLEFDAVWVELPRAPAGSGVFHMHPLRDLRLQRTASGAQAKQAWSGRFRRHGAYVSAGIALALV